MPKVHSAHSVESLGLTPLGDPVVMLVQDLLKRLALVVQTDV